MKIKKLSWDIYFLTMALAAARRSIDPSTKVGCLIVSRTKRIVSTGYNGPIQGSDDDLVSKIIVKRPDKYYIMIHAEENAVTTYSGSEQDITGATAYITCGPCHRCLRMLIQRGISRVVYTDAPNTKAKMLDEEEIKAQKLVLSCKKGIKLVAVPYAKVLANVEDMKSHLLG